MIKCRWRGVDKKSAENNLPASSKRADLLLQLSYSIRDAARIVELEFQKYLYECSHLALRYARWWLKNGGQRGREAEVACNTPRCAASRHIVTNVGLLFIISRIEYSRSSLSVPSWSKFDVSVRSSKSRAGF